MHPRPIRRRSALVAAATFATGMAPGLSFAQQFPDRPIKFVVGFGPGTGSDIQARALADVLARELKTPVVVENRAGAAGMLAATTVAAAAPDGYTVMLGTTTLIVTLPMLTKAAKYNGAEDFTPIGGTGKSPFIIVVGNKPGTPTSLKELLATMKQSNVSYGSVGNGSFAHLGSLRWMQEFGVNAVHVPYKSSPPALQDLVAGSLAFVTDSTVAALPLVRNGLLRPLAVTSAARLPNLPDVPTVAEVLGKPFEHTVWTGILAPKGTPAPVVQRLSAALKAALDSKEVQDRFNTMQLLPFAIDAPTFASYIRAEVPVWRNFLDRTGIRIDE